MLLAGDFICVLSNEDNTGQRNHSRALENLTKGCNRFEKVEKLFVSFFFQEHGYMTE
jgi:hypothetical protein